MSHLQQENHALKKQLSHARVWMKKEIFSRKKHITDKHTQLQEKIISYFPPESLSHFPENTLEHLMSAEMIFTHLMEGEHIDGSSMILEYQKALDEMIELYIVSPLRAMYQDGKHATHSPIETSLSLVIHKKYTLSIGRLYEILQTIHSSNSQVGHYEFYFREYLISQKSLYTSLIKSDFFIQLEEIIQLGVFNEKRHSGIVSFTQAGKARENICGNFENKHSLLYLLAQTQSL